MPGVVAPQCLPDGPWKWPSTVRGEREAVPSGRIFTEGAERSRPGSTSRAWSLICEDMEMEKHLNLLKLSQIIFFNPVNRSRSVSGASTGLSSSPLSSPRVRLDPQRIREINRKYNSMKHSCPRSVKDTIFVFSGLVCLRGFNHLSEVL